jgi:hypothetical protein
MRKCIRFKTLLQMSNHSKGANTATPIRLGELKPILQELAMDEARSLSNYVVSVMKKHVLQIQRQSKPQKKTA